MMLSNKILFQYKNQTQRNPLNNVKIKCQKNSKNNHFCFNQKQIELIHQVTNRYRAHCSNILKISIKFFIYYRTHLHEIKILAKFREKENKKV